MATPYGDGHDAEARSDHASRHRPYVHTVEDNPWLFTSVEVEESPSRVMNVPSHVEAEVLAKTARFVYECGNELKVPQLTSSVAIKFFQRFFMLESMLVHSPPIVAAACLFLSCKVQETHKRLRDIIYWTVKVRTRRSKDFPDGMELRENSPGYYEEKSNILDKEREVLRVLNFDLTLDHPYRHVWTITKSFISSAQTQKALTQAAWNFLNDSFGTYLHVQYDPKEIATASIFLGARINGIELPDGTGKEPDTGNRIVAWYEWFDVDVNRIEDICNRLLDIYDLEGKRAKRTFSKGPGINDSLAEHRTAKKVKASPEAPI